MPDNFKPYQAGPNPLGVNPGGPTSYVPGSMPGNTSSGIYGQLGSGATKTLNKIAQLKPDLYASVMNQISTAAGLSGPSSGGLFMSQALRGAPSLAETSASFAQQGLGRQAATRLGRIVSSQARLRLGTEGLEQERLFRLGVTQQQLGYQHQKDMASTEFKRSLLANTVDLGVQYGLWRLGGGGQTQQPTSNPNPFYMGPQDR